MTLSGNADAEVLARITAGDAVADSIAARKDGASFTVDVAFPRAGEFGLQIWGRAKASDDLRLLAEYEVQVRE